jgi:hypothetical protein
MISIASARAAMSVKPARGGFDEDRFGGDRGEHSGGGERFGVASASGVAAGGDNAERTSVARISRACNPGYAHGTHAKH